jgi:cytochrome c oxidase accessory protein FixG
MSSSSTEAGLYAAHKKVHAKEVAGRFNTLRVIAACVLLGLFYGLPWVRWEDHQAVLFDLPARKFFIFGLTFFPQDFFFLAWLLIIAALTLFFFTALAGRLWCGYACPQTVWTEVFVWIERWFEGNRQQRLKLDQAPWSVAKLARKGGKQAVWLAFAFYTGVTFVGYFTPIDTLFASLVRAELGGWEAFWCVFYGFATYGNAGFMREQVCKYMCPYARFQGAMFDRNTLVISYDTARGEPRGARPRGTDPASKGLGDCTDCRLCVQVCPTGIDIRQGLQLECIACAACIDACDDVMDKMRYPRGLVRYSTQASLEGKPRRVLRPRIVIYGVLLAMLIVSFAVALGHRRLLEVDVLRDRNALYRQSADGTIENVYTVRLVNKDTRAHRLHLSAEGLQGIVVDTDSSTYEIEPGRVVSIALRLRVPAGSVSGGRDVQVIVTSEDDKIRGTSVARFIAPP